MSLGGFAPLADDALLLGRRMFGRSGGDLKWQGKIPSDEFFAAARAGDPRALGSLKSMNYRAPWRLPFVKKGVAEEIIRGSERTALARLRPRGLLTGYKYYGLGRAASNFHVGPLKFAGIAGLGLTAFGMATASRGKMAEAGAGMAGSTVGGVAGAAAGAALLGLPGELIGGWIGGELGEKAGAVVDMAKKVYNQSRHLNFGSFQDNEASYTMRQRAVQEMGRSALNARQYLGKEAALMHT